MTQDHFKLTKKSAKKLDAKVRPVIIKLNEKGVKTYYSCQGHPRKKQKAQGYIIYEKGNTKTDQKFRQAGFKVTNFKMDVKTKKGQLRKKEVKMAEAYSTSKKRLDSKWKKVSEKLG